MIAQYRKGVSDALTAFNVKTANPAVFGHAPHAVTPLPPRTPMPNEQRHEVGFRRNAPPEGPAAPGNLSPAQQHKEDFKAHARDVQDQLFKDNMAARGLRMPTQMVPRDAHRNNLISSDAMYMASHGKQRGVENAPALTPQQMHEAYHAEKLPGMEASLRRFGSGQVAHAKNLWTGNADRWESIKGLAPSLALAGAGGLYYASKDDDENKPAAAHYGYR